MKKTIFSGIMVAALLSGGYFVYQVYSADVVTAVLGRSSVIGYIPKRIQNRMHAISNPFNSGTDAVMAEIHNSGIPFKKILSMIDNTTEEQVYSMLDEINVREPKTTNDFFDILQKHLNADFDMEVFRKAFCEHTDMKEVRKALFYVNRNRKTHDVDFNTGKAIIKQILIEKNEQYRERSRQ